MRQHRRAVVTGLGATTPSGTDPATMWESLLNGRTAAAPITTFDTTGMPVDFACAIPPFDLGPYLTAKEQRRMDRVTQLGMCAAQDAMADAGTIAAPPERRGLVVGQSDGGVLTQEQVLLHPDEHGRGRPPALFIPRSMDNATAATIAVRHAIRGPAQCLAMACASSGHAVGEALRLIRDGSADAVLAGGADAYITATKLLGFHGLGALSTRTDDPAAASRPFDSARDGFVFGEGAAFLVVEELHHAQERGARLYGELAGYGRTTDAHHLTAPPPDGGGIRRAVELALSDAELGAGEVAHVSAHATGTPAGDRAEARALADVFGPGGVAVSALKGSMGHMLGAAGAAQAVAAALTLRDGLAPPTANLDDLDPQCAIDAVAGAPRKLEEGAVLCNSSGFGGHNASVVLAPLP